MERFIIEHIPSGKVYCEDEGGSWLVDKKDPIISWGIRKEAEDMLAFLSDTADQFERGKIFTEDGSFPKEEFEVTLLK